MIRRCLRGTSRHRSAQSGARFGPVSIFCCQCAPWRLIRRASLRSETKWVTEQASLAACESAAISCLGTTCEGKWRPAGADSVQIRAGTTGSRAAWSVSARQALPWSRADGRSNGRALAQQTAWQPPMSVHRVMPVVELSVPFWFPDVLVNIAHFQKLDEVFHARWTPSGRSK
jgi:hypothetical protein